MYKKIYSKFFILLFFMSFLTQMANAVSDSSTESGDAQDQSAFPFDKPCLKFDKSNFQVGQPLLDVMVAGDFPQYCVLYSLSKYQVKQKRDDGYFLSGSKLDPQHADATTVFLKSNMAYQPHQLLAGHATGALKPDGQWAYFIGGERFAMVNGTDKEYYVFQEIDF